MLRSYALSKKNIIYYDIEKKTIARFPSNSNLLAKGSDNSLYFGMDKNEDVKKIFCELFKKNNIREISGLNFDMKCGYEDVNVVLNINAEGQIQIKLMKDGTMSRLTNNYAFTEMKQFDFTKMLLVIDFTNKEVRFKDPEDLFL